jgi:copper chaperone CopZ
MSIQIFLVDGMSCKNCKAHVESEIKTIQGVEEVVADHLTGHVKVVGNQVSVEKIKAAIEDAGYRFKGSDRTTAPGSDHWLS